MTGTPVVSITALHDAASADEVTWIDQHDREIRTAMAALRRDWPVLLRWGAALVEVFANGGRLLAAGNGGSAAEAQHLTAELVGRFSVSGDRCRRSA